MTPPPSPPPEHEPGGDRIIVVIVLIVVTALGGMLFSFLSRLNAPHDAPEIKARYLPPSARHEPDKAAGAGTAHPGGSTDAPAKP